MNRKRLLGIVLALAASPAASLIQPLRINFQGKLISPTTNNPQAGPVNLTLKLWNDPTSILAANLLYTEIQNSVPLTNGVFSVQIGTYNGIPRDLFLGASVYLGVTVAGDSEMLPRQSLVMSPYAYTANQLSDLTEVRLIAGPTYSTFTNAGNFTVPAGIVGSSGTFANGVTASSGTFLATGANQFSITTSSGINMTAGTLDVTGTSGIRADDTGITLSTIDFVGLATDPASANAGFMYYNTSTGSLKVFDGSGGWNYAFGQSLSRQSFITTTNTTAIVVNKTAAQMEVEPFYLPGPMMVRQLIVDETTAMTANGDIGVYTSTGGLYLHGGTNSLTNTTGLKTVTVTGGPIFLPPGAYYAVLTWNGAAGRFAGDTLGVAGIIPTVGTVAAGGGTTLPATMTFPITATTVFFLFEMNP